MVSLTGCSVKDYKYLEKNKEQINVVKEIDQKTYKKDLMFQWKILKGDRVEIKAYNQSSSSSSAQLTQLLSSGGQASGTQRFGDEGTLINTDGLVRLPLVGSVKLIGLTEDEASQMLIAKYKTYLKHPYVSVKILNQKLFVVGEVQRPGVVLVTNGTMSLFEALAVSGDLTDYANRTDIKIIRGDMRNPEIRQVNLNDLNSIRYASLILRPNDVIYVTPRDSKSSAAGIQDIQPFWNLISSMLSPFATAAVWYGVTQ